MSSAPGCGSRWSAASPSRLARNHALVARGYEVVTVVEQVRTGRLATARLRPRGSSVLVDLLFASCGLEPDIVNAAEPLEILPGLVVPVARTYHLIAMKLLARDDRHRPQDADDLRALMAIATTADRRLVPRSLAAISARGFARRRNLTAAWKQLLTESRRRTSS